MKTMTAPCLSILVGLLALTVSCNHSDSIGKVAGGSAAGSSGGGASGGGDTSTATGTEGGAGAGGAGSGGYAKGGSGGVTTRTSSTCVLTNLYCAYGYTTGPDGCLNRCAPAPDAGSADDAGRGDGPGVDSGVRPETGSESGRDISPAKPDLASDIAPVASCAGQPDFTPCVVVTTPDRKYDVCMAGVCVSPGCGDTTCNVSGPHFPLSDTGQRLCSDDRNGTIDCPAPGAALYGQDAQYGWDTTHAKSERYTRDLSATDEPLVVDNVTGLTWQGCEAGLRGNDCTSGSGGAYLWQDAVAYCDGLSWGGYRDWHLPDPYELDSIAEPTAALDTTVFPATHLSGAFYWSISTSASGPATAWTLSGSDFDKTNKEPARCVRGGTISGGARFARDSSVVQEPVVIDSVTGLVWQGCTAGLSGRDCDGGAVLVRYWADWLGYCEGLSWAGKTDWRLPNWKELRSIVDTRQSNPAIDAAAFPGTPSDRVYLSSTGNQCIISSINPSDRNCLVVGVLFSKGSLTTTANVVSPGYGRCVRGGL